MVLGYNYDFLDDPSFDPFQTKSSVKNDLIDKPPENKLASTQEKPTSAQHSEPRVISSLLDLETNPEPKESSTPLNLNPSPTGTSTPSPVEPVSARPNKYKIDDSYVVPEPLDLEKLINSESPNQVFYFINF